MERKKTGAAIGAEWRTVSECAGEYRVEQRTHERVSRRSRRAKRERER